EPEELILSAGAGTLVKEIEECIEIQGQMLAFEPPDLGPLLGGPSECGTLGGLLACNLAGPRRIKSGAARDHFLGVEAVSGRGEAFKAGGRVVKNVSGYDMMKVLAGSFGTMAAMTLATVKVLPRPEKTYSVLLYGLDRTQAVAALTEALCSSHEVSGAAYLPPELAERSQVSLVSNSGQSVTAIRVEGPGPSVRHRTAALRRELGEFGESEELHSQNSLVFWKEVRDVAPFHEEGDRLIWRVSLAPSECPYFLNRIEESIPDVQTFLDWGGGLIWLSLPHDDSAWCRRLRALLPNSGGHATLIRAPQGLRAANEVFQPQPDALAGLSKRLKESFDPLGILNPGRMAVDY
ncbi:MAG: FAD-binding protein, partial [Kiloniellales bacterium]|nr:FAD-binding protein [Kiloniellales bacterium]